MRFEIYTRSVHRTLLYPTVAKRNVTTMWRQLTAERRRPRCRLKLLGQAHREDFTCHLLHPKRTRWTK